MTESPASGRVLPQTSLIVCSRNRPEMLVETVESIFQGEEMPTELIVIDQSDEPNEHLAEWRCDAGCELRYMWSDTKGLSRACNAGVEAAHFDVLVFTHDDVLVTPDWFGSVVRSLLEHGEHAVITGRVLPEDKAAASGFVPSTKTDEAPAVYEGRIAEGVLYPMNMAMYRQAFHDVGAFDERLGPGTPFPAAEDNDLCFRLLDAGYCIVYAPEATLYHRAWRSDDDYIPLRWSYGLGQGAFYAKHISLRDRFILRSMGWEIQHRGRRLIRRALREPAQSLGEFAYLAGLLSGAISWPILSRRKR